MQRFNTNQMQKQEKQEDLTGKKLCSQLKNTRHEARDSNYFQAWWKNQCQEHNLYHMFKSQSHVMFRAVNFCHILQQNFTILSTRGKKKNAAFTRNGFWRTKKFVPTRSPAHIPASSPPAPALTAKEKEKYRLFRVTWYIITDNKAWNSTQEFKNRGVQVICNQAFQEIWGKHTKH